MRNSLAVLLLGSCALWAQNAPLGSHTSLKIDFPKDSPVTVVSADWGESRASARGSAIVLDLRTALTLRNAGQQRIHGVSLLVLAQEVTAGGKASVTVPSLDVAPGETFPIRIDLRLLRPLAVGDGPLVRVSLDGVLFDNLSFYGPNRLNSRRMLTVWEMEARRDRQYFKSVLAAGGAEALQKVMLESLARQADRPRIDVRLSRGRATAFETGQDVRFAFLEVPDSPVEPLDGQAVVSGNEARMPSIEVRNRSNRPVRYFEIGWVIRDRDGREFLAGSVPASDPELRLGPGAKGRVSQQSSLRFTGSPGRFISIAGMTGFVSQVEYSDGSVWVPSRTALRSEHLARVVVPSPEEQRLTDLYRRKGLGALVTELKKY